jgi:hypothetical protein
VPNTSAGTIGQGFSTASLREALEGLGPVNMGALADVERWRPAEHAAMLEEAEALTRLAIDVGVSNVQLLTGPVAPGGRYSGPAELSPAELRRATSQAVAPSLTSGHRSGSATTSSRSAGRRSVRSPGPSR